MAVYFNSDTYPRAVRLFRILTLLASRAPFEPLGLSELAAACDCSKKTIQRDLDCLQQAQVPLRYDQALRAYVLPEKGWKLPVASLSATDVLALSLVRGLLSNTSAPLPFAEEIRAALEKVSAGLTPGLRAQMEALAGGIAETQGLARDYSHAPMGVLLQAIQQRQTLEILYESYRSQTCQRRCVDPYALDRREGRYLELHAWCHRRQQVLVFALDRIYEAVPTGQTFIKRPWKLTSQGVVGGLRGGTPVAVVVRFDAEVAPFARARRWPFAARITEDPAVPGAILLRGQVRGLDGIVRELLSWRSHAQVLGGPELRARMAQEVQALAALYAEPENP
ncbi:MAG TPA: WYL domain-containing protein [Chthonomonadaceae bacterium]|nr:WYL domain-containing protein [Chthonomonadaceae bacterium]